MRSLGLATDLLALRGTSTVERHADRLVVRTPAQPDFWWGNYLIFRGPPGDAAAEAARFRADFPEAGHLAVAWDAPGLDPGPLRAPWAALGAEIDLDDVLAREGPPPGTPAPEGYVLRELDPARGEDWRESLRVALASGLENGHEEAGHRPFLERRVRARREEVAAGRLRWWGAFRGGEMAAQMGLVEGEVEGRPLARFQEVDTHPDHRRRGLCAALLALAGAAARAPTLVIVATAEGDAGRIYRRGGFSLAERSVSAHRRAA